MKLKILISVTLLLILSQNFFGKSKNKEIVIKENVKEENIENLKNEFSNDELKKYLKEIHIKFPDIVYAQAVLETGNFCSPLFIAHSNMFGMKLAKNRPQVYSYVTKNGYIGHGNNWKESVINYALFQAAYMRKLNKDQYYAYLKDNYAEDPNYVKKLKKIVENNKM